MIDCREQDSQAQVDQGALPLQDPVNLCPQDQEEAELLGETDCSVSSIDNN